MALLTADDVLNKKFQPTKFREGYDQDEVDDFLDEVVATLRVVNGENDELKAKLEAAERRIAELSGQEPAQPDETTRLAAVGAEEQVVETAEAEVPAEPEEPEAAPEVAEPEPAPEPEAPAAAAGTAASGYSAASAPSAASAGEPESATGMLALAQRLHDEYVSNGKAEADRILTEARSEGERLVSDAEEQRSRTLNQLEGERSLLERKIDELRVFERDYRTRLKSYLEGLLGDVEGRGSGLSGYGSGSEHDPRRP
ncbi:MAG TPA: DivIVA domain-containing protein [Beutenbergiaceae bacterium]|nr:DivIVA domain-containing protein [Beutenbergiaceae bacterium]